MALIQIHRYLPATQRSTTQIWRLRKKGTTGIHFSNYHCDRNQKPFQKNRRSIFRSNSISDFQIKFAITIPIKKRSGKIADRFSFRNRSAISGSKSITDFRFEIDQRLKNGFRNKNSDGTQNRIAIFVQKSITDFEIKIDQRFSFRNRSAIFRSKSRSRSRSKTLPGKFDQRFSDQNRIPISIPRPAPSQGTPSPPGSGTAAAPTQHKQNSAPQSPSPS